MNLTDVPGLALDRTLQLWRAPLTLTQTILRQNGEAVAWPPAMAFERFEAGARELVGNLVHDERLIERARLQRTKLAQVARAAGLEAEASLTRDEADRTRDARLQEAEKRRQVAKRQADQREEVLERERHQAKASVRKQAATRKAAEQHRAEGRREATQVREVAAKKKELDAEAKALSVEDRAVKAKGRALQLEDDAARRKAARKAAAARRSRST